MYIFLMYIYIYTRVCLYVDIYICIYMNIHMIIHVYIYITFCECKENYFLYMYTCVISFVFS